MQTPPVAVLGIAGTGKNKGCFSPLKNKTVSPVPSSDKRKRRACRVSDYSLREILRKNEDVNDDCSFILTNPGSPRREPKLRFSSVPPASITVRPLPCRRLRTQKELKDLFSSPIASLAPTSPSLTPQKPSQTSHAQQAHAVIQNVANEDADGVPRCLPSSKRHHASRISSIFQKIDEEITTNTSDVDDLVLVSPRSLVEASFHSISLNHGSTILRPRASVPNRIMRYSP